MTVVARNKAIATQARRIYIEALVNGVVALGRVINEAAAKLLLQPVEYAVMVARRDGVQAWNRHGPAWQAGVISGIRHAAVYGVIEVSKASEPANAASPLSLVDDDTIEREITASRLSLAMMDKATWEFTDLRTRMQVLEQQDELAAQDLFRANVVAKLVLDAWTRSGLSNSDWQMLRSELHQEFAQLLGEAYHEVNAWLLTQAVMPEVDLRPFIRRAAQAAGTPAYPGMSAEGQLRGGGPIRGGSGLPMGSKSTLGHPSALAARSPISSQAEEVLRLLQRIVGGQVPAFASTRHDGRAAALSAGATALAPSPGGAATGLAPRLSSAIKHAQEALQRAPLQSPGAPEVAAPQVLEELQTRNQAFKQVLKQAAETPAERATIELVAMMFQSILMEEHIPATVRVWFARLQMPVLRVAVSEPDFFATTDHPARQLIDRMGSCVMGFSAGAGGG
ncbi:DUF1631 family protein, partial [Roseateles sp.]|uniref:DUF1631 family protein n=1 Tax=Roseateles sp. TaxID=1971397 RepID=UPI00286B0868